MRTRTFGAGTLLLAAVLVYALTLRGPVVALAPVVDDVARGLGVGPESVGLLTGVPVLCFALAAPLASLLLAQAGIERAVGISLVGVLAGTVLRSVGGFETAVAATAIIGVSITVGNVAVPVLIGRDFPRTSGMATGLYTAALNLGSVLTTLLTAPLASVVGWRWALATWGSVAVVALVLWRRAVAGRPSEPVRLVGAARPGDGHDERPVWRRPVLWCLVGMFSGQAFSYYAVTTWLPTILADLGGMTVAGAGGAASLFQLAGMVGGVGVPLLVARRLSLRAVFAGLSVLWLSLPAGLLVAPELWPLWALLAGVAQGGNFTVVFTLVVHHSRDQVDSRRMSAVVQGVGYSAAAAGPSLLGAVHTATDGWTVPLVVVLGALTVMTVSGFAAASLPLRRRRGA
ncbi:MFS transporter [Sanguibacter suaedae]|uniref:MFS transporter n=1 Tax=Sanguibacter suaedae TaxID=2795737 RepID=A0A934IDJ7_9MICO|nr:MFS transporter [Sanguibacter suaedae]MBI9116018.1 MFS transporter [Sanguibacter suaedae]